MRSPALIVTVALAVGVGSPRLAQGRQWFLTKLADTHTPIPGGTGTFSHLGFGIPGLGGGVAGFAGQNQAGTFAGVYRSEGAALSVVANTATPIPAGTGSFIGFYPGYAPSIDQSDVAFIGNGAGTTFIQQGVYLRSGSNLTRVVDRNTPIPGTTTTFFSLGGPSLDGGAVAFPGFNNGNTEGGIYRWEGGSLSAVADYHTPIPGGSGTFNNFGETSADSGLIAVSGGGPGGQNGIYLGDSGGVLTRRYDTTTPLPGASGTFIGYQSLSLDGGALAFVGGGLGQSGVYSDAGGALAPVALYLDPAPGIPGTFFSDFGTPSLDDGFVAFAAALSGAFLGDGLFTDYGGTLAKILATGDVLDGRTVSTVRMGREGHSGDSIAFYVGFTDQTRAIYMATIPAPGAGVLIGLGLAAVLRRRRRGGA